LFLTLTPDVEIQFPFFFQQIITCRIITKQYALPDEAKLISIFNISVAVTITGDVFRGFFLQARDVATGAWVGTWEEAPNTKGLPECAAITHGDNKDKVQAIVVWTAPPKSPGGQVFFT
jgi:hypothetical protein